MVTTSILGFGYYFQRKDEQVLGVWGGLGTKIDGVVPPGLHDPGPERT